MGRGLRQEEEYKGHGSRVLIRVSCRSRIAGRAQSRLGDQPGDARIRMQQSNSPARRSPGFPRIIVAGGAIVAVAVFAAAAAPRPTTPPAPPDVVAARADTDRLAVNNVVYQGWKMFEVYCTRCHGEDAVGSSFRARVEEISGPIGHDRSQGVLPDRDERPSGQRHADMGEHCCRPNRRKTSGTTFARSPSAVSATGGRI